MSDLLGSLTIALDNALYKGGFLVQNDGEAQQIAKVALSAIEASGYRVVPKEPTEEMLSDADSAIPRFEPDFETNIRMMRSYGANATGGLKSEQDRSHVMRDFIAHGGDGHAPSAGIPNRIVSGADPNCELAIEGQGRNRGARQCRKYRATDHGHG